MRSILDSIRFNKEKEKERARIARAGKEAEKAYNLVRELTPRTKKISETYRGARFRERYQNIEIKRYRIAAKN